MPLINSKDGDVANGTSHASPKTIEANPEFYQDLIWRRGMRGEKPTISTDPSQWERMAKECLPATAWGYVSGNAGVGETHAKNIDAFRRWAFIPRRLSRCDSHDLYTSVWGKKLHYPFGICPMGVMDLYHEDGEKGVAAAAAALGVPFVLSNAASTSIEDAAAANGNGERWFQLDWIPKEYNNILLSLMQRAKNAGYRALVLTLDMPVIAWRPGLLDNAFNPFLQGNEKGCAIAFSDPEFQARFKDLYGKGVYEDMSLAAAEWDQMQFPGQVHSWEDLAFIRKHWEGPLVLKGILHPEDAKQAVELGVQGIWISNHGGRQMDGSITTLDALQAIADNVGDRASIIFDSGVRTGVDILKALALGADCVMIGRPCIWGLAIGGRQGVEHVLKTLLGELRSNMVIAGIPSVQREHLNRLNLVRTD